MKTKLQKLVKDFIIVWGGDFSFGEEKDMSKQLQSIIDEVCKEQKSFKYNSKGIIGDVHDSFDDLKHKHYDWSSYYNGWLNGRAEMLNEIKHISQPETGIKL